MNPKAIFKLFSPTAKAQAVVQQGVSTLIISSVVLSGVALTAHVPIVQASGPEPSGQHTIEVFPNAEADIGLMEFFSPGHGAISRLSKEAEVLPIETDMDEDLGLMEFFTIPHEAGVPQAIETDADQDIGLIEFRPQVPVGLK